MHLRTPWLLGDLRLCHRLIKTTKEHMDKAPKDSPLWTLVEGDINKVSGRTAFDAMRQGRPHRQGDRG